MNSLCPVWFKRKAIKEPDPNLSKYSAVLYEILAHRGITGNDKIEAFIRPTLKKLHSPQKLPNIKAATDRLFKALQKKENILIFGDYDADGIISSALLYNFLKKLDVEPDIHIPSRFEDGYDINLEFVKKINRQKKYGLIICVDCGTNSMPVMQFVNSDQCNLDIIVCDHHQPSNEVENFYSDRYIIINPKLRESIYPFKDLSGAGVTFKFIVNILRQLGDKPKENFDPRYLTNLLDLVAISTVVDVMPLIDENRIIVKKGLKVMEKTTHPGLQILLQETSCRQSNLTTYDLGFIIGPRLNAAGRLKSAQDSVDILKCDGCDIENKVKNLERFNQKRKDVQEEILNQILEQKNIEKKIHSQKTLIEKSTSWNEGVLGIVASSIVKRYNVPALLFKEKDGILKGSGRSTDNFDLYFHLTSLRHYFKKFGGHQQACGITMEIEKYQAFKKDYIKLTSSSISDFQLKKTIKYDMDLDYSQIDENLLQQLSWLEPHGRENPRPVFKSSNCKVIKVDQLKDGRHLKIKLKQGKTNMEALFFNPDSRIKDSLSAEKVIDILYQLQLNEWNGRRTIQLVLIDVF